MYAFIYLYQYIVFYLTNITFLLRCRAFQNAFNECMSTKLNIDFPEKDYFNRTRLHTSDSPKEEPAPAPMPERFEDLPDFHKYGKHKDNDVRSKMVELNYR